MAELVRLQKFISECGIMSRRAAEDAIENSRIAVNGVTASIGEKIDPAKDKVTLDGNLVRVNHDKKLYVMLNKPVGYLTSMSDDRGRQCVTELLQDVPARVYPCGRLDMDSEGMLILSNDGEFTNLLTHPGHNLGKLYHVKVNMPVTPEILEALRQPMDIDGYTIKPVDVRLISLKTRCSVLSFELFEGRNRQIRKMCQQNGLHVLSLRRVSIGNLELGTLKSGEWRYLSAKEINYLKNAIKRK